VKIDKSQEKVTSSNPLVTNGKPQACGNEE